MVHLSYLIFASQNHLVLVNFDKFLNTYPIPQSDKLPFGSGEKVSIAVKFSGMGPKILDPRLAPIELVENQ